MTRQIVVILLTILLVSAGMSTRALAEQKVYTLEEVLDMAERWNPSVAIIEARLKAAKARIVAASAFPNPEVSLESADYPDDYRYSLTIEQPFEWYKKRAYRKASSREALGVVEYEKEALMRELKWQIKRAFYRILFVKEEVSLLIESKTVMEEFLSTVRKRVNAGEDTLFSLLRAQVETMRIEKELKTSTQMLHIARTVLNALLGNRLPNGFELKGDFHIKRKSYEKDELVEKVLATHPLIKREEKRMKQARLTLLKEKAAVVPDVRLGAGMEREEGVDATTLGVSLSVPIWYRNRGAIEEAQAEVVMSEAELRKTRIELTRETAESYRKYRMALDRVELFEKGLLKEAQEALRIAEKSYRFGETDLLNYLDTQRVQREVLLEYNRALFELALAMAEIEKLLGEI